MNHLYFRGCSYNPENKSLSREIGEKNTDGDKTMADLLGGKGANLAEMCNLGINVPPGFTVTTEVCNYFIENKTFPKNFLSTFYKNSCYGEFC